MRNAPLLVCLLLLASVLVDLAVLSAISAVGGVGRQWPDPLLVGPFSLAFSQVNLVTIWAGLGRGPLPWRLAAVVAVVTSWSLALAAVVTNALKYTSEDWTLLLLAQSASLLWILWFHRARGTRFVHAGQIEPDMRRPRWQFSLGYLFAWITATAITLGMLRWTVDYELLAAGGYHWGDMIVVSLLNAGLGLAILHAVLNSMPLVFRVLTICSALAAAGCVAPLLGSAHEHSAALAVLWVLEVLWMTAALGVLRVAGFRLKPSSVRARTRE